MTRLSLATKFGPPMATRIGPLIKTQPGSFVLAGFGRLARRSSRLDWRAKVELFEKIRREYFEGVGTILVPLHQDSDVFWQENEISERARGRAAE
jgi:hypothetical protein